MNKKIILSAFAALAINTNVIAGFFDNLVDNLKNGDLNSLVSDVVTDVANEIDEAQDDSDIKGNTESNDVLNNLGTLFNNSNASDNSDSYSEDEAEHNIDSEEKEVDMIVVDYDQLSSPGQSFLVIVIIRCTIKARRLPVYLKKLMIALSRQSIWKATELEQLIKTACQMALGRLGLIMALKEVRII
jgi:hypothetical protein